VILDNRWKYCLGGENGRLRWMDGIYWLMGYIVVYLIRYRI